MNQDRIRIMIADDHDMVRQTWKLLLERNPAFIIVAECDNGMEAIEVAQAEMPDIILMDINMQPVNGFEATRRILELVPTLKIIGISINNQVSYARNIIKLGARGFVTKNSPFQEMETAIVEVHGGNTFICAEIRERMRDDRP